MQRRLLIGISCGSLWVLIFGCRTYEIAHVLKAAHRHEIESLVLGQPFGTRFTNGRDQVGVEEPSFSPWTDSSVERYNVEPFFWSSSLGWIPSRFQESVVPGDGDRQYRMLCPKAPLISCTDITVVLKFIRTMKHDMQSPFSIMLEEMHRRQPEHSIDIQAPLFLRSSPCHIPLATFSFSSQVLSTGVLLPDLLALHIVRSPATSTIISYHSGHDNRTTPASSLHSRLNAAGRSVYWNHIFSKHKDPTFIFLSLLWYALYAWDESFEDLYRHVCFIVRILLDLCILLNIISIPRKPKLCDRPIVSNSQKSCTSFGPTSTITHLCSKIFTNLSYSCARRQTRASVTTSCIL